MFYLVAEIYSIYLLKLQLLALYQSVLLDSTHTGSYMSGDSKHINNNSSINLQHQNHIITNIENVASPIAASLPKVKKAQTNYKRNTWP
jgi:hypothetical protein